MSKEKYPNIFSTQMEAIVFIILQIFFAARGVLKIGVRSRVVFRPIARERQDLIVYNYLYPVFLCKCLRNYKLGMSKTVRFPRQAAECLTKLRQKMSQ